MERKSGYMYGSTAPNLPRREERPEQQTDIQKKPAIRPLPAHSQIPKAKMVFCIVFVMAVSFIMLYRYSVIAELNYKMGNMTDEYNQLIDQNRKLEVEITTSVSLERVKQIAEKDLNMHKPESYQIVVVSVPKNNYSVVVDQSYIDQATKSASLMEKLFNAVKAVLP